MPAALVEEAARVYAEGPSLLWLGQAFQRQSRGGNAMRAVAMLPALTGNLGRPGTGWAYVTGKGTRGIDGDYLAATHLARSPAPVSHMDLADVLADPERSRALVCWNINPAASNPRPAELRRALARDDLLTVSLELFQTDTADLADYVLPAASFLESDDLVCSYFHHTLSAQVAAAPPPGEALPNSEIFRRLARAMELTEPELQESDRDLVDELLRRSGTGVGWDELAARGTVRLYPEPRIQYAELEFATPSGRIELASALGRRGRAWTHRHAAHDARPAGGRLRLLSPASPWAMNTSFANDPKIARRLGEPTVTVHPDDAALRGLRAGDRVELANDAGRMLATLAVEPIVPVGVAYCPKGHWPKRTRDRHNVNSLNAGTPSDMGRSTSVHGVEATITLAGSRPQS